MFVHNVYFWLKPGLTEAERKQFEAGLHSLITIASVKQGWAGKPAATDRPIIDRTYSYGLVVVFEDAAAHDTYQIDPVHDAFRTLSHFWSQVRIYDFTT